MLSYTLTNLLVSSKGWSGVHLSHDNASSHKCEVVPKSFLASARIRYRMCKIKTEEMRPVGGQ